MTNKPFKANIDPLINEISKIVLINAGFCNNNGLYNGKSGAVSFLYHLESYNGNEIYYNLANELVLEITSVLYGNGPANSFSDGYTGIGWTYNYLTKNDFIEIPKESDPLELLSHDIIKNAKIPLIEQESIGDLFYISSRILDGAGSFSSDNLENLLVQEKLIAYVDRIDNNEVLSRKVKKNEFLDDLLRDNARENLSSRIEKIFLSVAVANYASNTGVFPAVTKKLIQESIVITQSYLDCIYSITNIDHDFVQENSFTVTNMTCKLYLSRLRVEELGISSNCLERFLEAISRLHELGELHSIKDGIEKFIHLEINSIIILMNINNHAKAERLASIIDKKLEILVALLDSSEMITDSFSSNNGLNVGLTGLSGLGLMLLQYKQVCSAEWNSALFI